MLFVHRMIGILIFIGLSFVPLWVCAEDDGENMIKYRRNYMNALGGHMGSAAQIVRGKISLQGHLAFHVRAIDDLSKDLKSVFPEGSDFGETRAKMEVWDEWPEFEKAADTARERAAALRAAVEAESADIGERFQELGKACKACHERFREEEE